MPRVWTYLALLAAGCGLSVADKVVVNPNASLPHWVGPKVGRPIDSACYRKTYRTNLCPPGYDFDNWGTCWAQCPIEYPVECGMECLPQNEDCTLAIFRKVNAVATVALNAATAGVFKDLITAYDKIGQGVMCTKELYGVVQKVVQTVQSISHSNVDTTVDQVRFLVMKSDVVVVDLPKAVAKCLKLPIADKFDKAGPVVDVVKRVVDGVIDTVWNKLKAGGHFESSEEAGKELISLDHPDNLLNITANSGIESVADLTPDDIDALKGLVQAGATCGVKVKAVIDKVVDLVKQMKSSNPKTTVDKIRLTVATSKVVVQDLPDAVSFCAQAAPDGFKTRDQILKTVHVIIDRIVDASSSQNGTPTPVSDYLITIANMGLDAISLFDRTGLANLAKEFIQPICGPTAFLGEIDDGPADMALGLRTVQKAFRNSTGQWTKQGSDAMINITFHSVDIHDVKVRIKSGGDLFEKVPVKKGETVVWTRPIADLQDKTLYLDRWRPGFLGLPGLGGGSLLVWVPRSETGHLHLDVMINPTKFSDKDRLRGLQEEDEEDEEDEEGDE